MLFQAKVGKFGIKALKLKGRMSMLLKPLTSEWLPCFRSMSYAFINQPELELTFTGLALVAEFSYIDRTVKKILNDALASMVVLPYRLIYRMDEDVSLMEIYQPPHGIARLTLESARGFQMDKKSFGPDDITDVYCTISFGDATVRTPTILHSFSPVWNHAMDFMVFDLDQSISLNAWDENSGTVDMDGDLGVAHVTVRELLLSKDRRMKLPLFDKEPGPPTGAFLIVKCDLIPLLLVPNAKIPESLPDNQLVGVLVILVRQAFDIPLPVKEAATMVKVKAGDDVFVTGVVKDAPGYDAINPLYDCVFHIPIATEKPDVKFSLIQEKNKVLGTHTVSFADVLKTPTIHRQNQRMGEDGAKLEFSVQLLTVEGTDSSTPLPSRSNTPPRLRPTFSAVSKSAASSSLDNSREPSPPESVEMRKIRVTAVRGKGFQARKRFLQKDDTPDVYLKIFFGDSSPWQTSTACNATTPSWDESKVYTFVSTSETFRIEAWDQNSTRLGRDGRYGKTSASINKILLDGGTTDLELESNGEKLGLYITLSVALLD
jgi:C2 domain